MSRIYARFSCISKRNQEGKAEGIFAVAFYKQFDSKKPFYKTVEKFELWQNDNFTNICQSYWYLNEAIYYNQGVLEQMGVTEIVIVMHTKALYIWLRDNDKINRKYRKWVNKATKDYEIYGDKEIVIDRVLSPLVADEDKFKARYFCQEKFISNGNQSKELEVEFIDTSKIQI